MYVITYTDNYFFCSFNLIFYFKVLSINDEEINNKSQKETLMLISNSPKGAKITLIRSHTGEVPTPPPQRHSAPPPSIEDELSALKIHVSKRDTDNVEVIKLVKVIK